MPELPEVEALAAFLRERAVGHVVARVDVTSIQVLKTYDPPVTSLAGLTVTGAVRRGKFLDLDVDGLHLVVHLARAGWLQWRDALPPGAGPDRETSLPPGYASGLTMRTPVIEMPVYLRWLTARVEELGGTVTRMNLSALPTGDVLVVDASGIGARLLGGDHGVAPVRGQVVLVEQVGLDRWWIDAETPTYVVPRSRDIVLGGTAIEGEWSRTPDPRTAELVLARATEIEPRLAGARVLRHKVGLRPGRAAVRLEREGDVIHCYGHGGFGVTVSWGCADDVVGLAGD